MAVILSKVPQEPLPVGLPAGWTVSGSPFFDGLTQSWKVHSDRHGEGILKSYKGWNLAPDETGEFKDWFSKRRIHHPGWPNELATGITKSVPWVIEQPRTGDSLGARMAKLGRPSINATIQLGIQLSRILEVAHQNQLAHGALSPGNVLVQESSSEPCLLLEIGVLPHVLQGGIGRLLAVVSDPVHFRFMAPETLVGRGVTNFSDFFSLGSLLYWSLTGEVPYSGDTPDEIIANHALKAPRTPPELRMGVPQGLSQLVMRLLSLQPGHRLKSMAEVGSTLDRLSKVGANIQQDAGYEVNTQKSRPAPGTADLLKAEMEELDKHLFQHPGDGAVLYKKAVVLHKMGCLSKAVDICKSAISHNPRLGHAWQLQAQCLLEMDESKKALEIWNRLSAAIPANALFHLRRAKAHIQLHDLDQATTAIADAVKADPNFSEISLVLAELLKVQKRFEPALEELEKTLKNQPNQPDALCLRNEIKFRLKDQKGALADLCAAVKAHPDHSPSRSAKARLLMVLKRAEDATEDVDDLVKRQPDCLDHRLLRIQQRLNTGDPATALEDAEYMSKEAKPGDEILRHQAWLLATIGDGDLRDPKTALEIAREGCEATGWADPDWLESVAAAYAASNQFEGAIGWQTKALQILDDCALPAQKARLDQFKSHKPFRIR